MTRISDMTALNALPVAGAFAPVEVPGSAENWRYDLSKLSSRQDGLFADAASRVVPTGTDMVSTTGYSSLGVGAANYVYDAAVDATYVAAHPRSSFLSENARGFRLDHEQEITPQIFGAAANGVTDDSAAFVAALAYLKAFNLNAGVVDAYKGSPKLFIPAGNYYLGATTLDITHSLIIEGEGSGRAPSPAWGCTHLRWADGVCGIRTQFPNTSGTTTLDVVQHDGVGSVYLRNFSMEGGYAGADSASHAIVVRAITFLDDLLIRNWGGTGVLTWIGNVNGTDYGGNADVSRFTGVKVQDCKIAFDSRGTNANVMTFINCEAYQCRQAGFVDENGAGSNTYIGTHATYNGLISGSGSITQVSRGGNFYAVRWGQEVGAATNAPSGTTADNTWWIYFGVGAPDSSHPAWVNGMSNLIGGGDYVMLSAFPTVLINCYVEGGGFSQLGVGTLAIAGTNLGISSAGGSCLVPEYDGIAFKRLHGAAIMHFDSTDGGAGGVDARDSTGMVGGATWNNQGGYYVAKVASGHLFYSLAAGVQTGIGSWSTAGLNLPTGLVYSVNATQVVGPRRTGWTAATGTPARGSFAAAAAGTVSAAYVQAEAQASRDRIAALEARFIALEADARAHGLIN